MALNKNEIRENNLIKIKKLLFKKKDALTAELAKETGLSVVTVNSIVKQLVEESVVTEGELIKQPLGRPAISYSFNYDRKHYLLLSIQEELTENGRKLIIISSITNLAGDQKEQEKFDFAIPSLSLLISITKKLVATDYVFEKIGVSIPGKLFNGVIVSSWENLLTDWNIIDQLEQATGLTVVSQNDAHLLTIGYCVQQNFMSTDTVVGIFYPMESMPGITILSQGRLIEGAKNSAGEAKYLPFLLDKTSPKTDRELAINLSKIIDIYNAVIAPNSFVISLNSPHLEILLETIEQSDILNKQLNKPTILFPDEFQKTMWLGLFWLVTKDTFYEN
ncbi:ROK family protein [Enterococcus sp. LJL99]